ncbi:hypothetical protein [Streptomyces nitrosporeus]|uniref:hypothetical protein n=1 Tax=Streptomyces nitrosporeus TaxID=28894 RepID=UPI0039A0C404
MSSRVPELIDALMSRLPADPVLAGVQVVDGPEVTESTAPDWLIIGWSGDPDGDFQAAQTIGGWSGLAASGREEQLQLTAAVIVTRGDTDVRAARVRAYEIGGRLEGLLAADPSVGLRSLEVAIEASQLVQDQTDQGVQVRLLLTVAGRAFT